VPNGPGGEGTAPLPATPVHASLSEVEEAHVTTATAPAGPTAPVNTTRAMLATVVLGTALAYMSDDMLNLAIPSVARDLGASMTGVQWILTATTDPGRVRP